VCKYITYFQSLIYFRTELLTRVKFSRHVWTGFCGLTGDGKWSHHKSLSIYSSEIQDTFNCIRFRRYCWRRLVVWWAFRACKIRCSNPGGSVMYFPMYTLITYEFVKNSENLRLSENLEVFRISKKSNWKFYRFELYELLLGLRNPRKKERKKSSSTRKHFRMLFQSSKLSSNVFLPRFSEKRRSSFELWALKELSKISPQVGLALQTTPPPSGLPFKM